MSHFSRPTENLCRKPFLLPGAVSPGSETRRTSGKWSKTYILSISGSSNAVLIQTNRKLPGEYSTPAGKLSTAKLTSPGSGGKILVILRSVKHGRPSPWFGTRNTPVCSESLNTWCGLLPQPLMVNSTAPRFDRRCMNPGQMAETSVVKNGWQQHVRCPNCSQFFTTHLSAGYFLVTSDMGRESTFHAWNVVDIIVAVMHDSRGVAFL